MKAENVSQRRDPEFFQVMEVATRAWLDYYSAMNDLEQRYTKTQEKRCDALRRNAEKAQQIMDEEASLKGYEI
jgi:hypothetical protein